MLIIGLMFSIILGICALVLLLDRDFGWALFSAFGCLYFASCIWG